MLGDAGNRPYSYGRSKGKSLDPALFYEKFKIRYDLILPDQEVEERIDLLEILREIKDDDHADRLISVRQQWTNWWQQNKDRIRGDQMEPNAKK